MYKQSKSAGYIEVELYFAEDAVAKAQAEIAAKGGVPASGQMWQNLPGMVG